MKCPECGSLLADLERFGHATRYRCRTHGAFLVSDTAHAMGFWDEPQEVRADALRRARARAQPGQVPLIAELI